jgi:voltage-gated potassium channel
VVGRRHPDHGQLWHMYPITALGRLIGAAVSILGIGMFALPAGILASGFAEEIRHGREEHTIVCPHCGMQINTRHHR